MRIIFCGILLSLVPIFDIVLTCKSVEFDKTKSRFTYESKITSSYTMLSEITAVRSMSKCILQCTMRAVCSYVLFNETVNTCQLIQIISKVKDNHICMLIYQAPYEVTLTLICYYMHVISANV